MQEVITANHIVREIQYYFNDYSKNTNSHGIFYGHWHDGKNILTEKFLEQDNDFVCQEIAMDQGNILKKMAHKGELDYVKRFVEKLMEHDDPKYFERAFCVENCKLIRMVCYRQDAKMLQYLIEAITRKMDEEAVSKAILRQGSCDYIEYLIDDDVKQIMSDVKEHPDFYSDVLTKSAVSGIENMEL